MSSNRASVLKAKFKDLQFPENVGRDAIIKLMTRLGLSAAECGILLQYFGASETDQINVGQFIDYLYSEKAQTAGAQEKAAEEAAKDGHVVSSWNIRSPELTGNLFEMYPADSTLTDPEQQRLMRELTLKANALMLSSDPAAPSARLNDLLPHDLPLQVLNDEASGYAGTLEKAPLLETHQEGLEKFLTPRLKNFTPETLTEYVRRFREDPAVRWAYWRGQRVHEFIADDGSGGKSKVNKIIASTASPILDDVAWNLALGVADMKYHFCSTRVPRSTWLYPQGAVGQELSQLKKGGPKPGEYDLFKLMVWDLILEKVRDSARKDWHQGEAHWDQTFSALKENLGHTPSSQEHMAKIVKRLIQIPSDIFVLVEASEEVIGGDPAPLLKQIEKESGIEYSLIRCSTLDETSNVAVLVRKSSFVSHEVQELLDSEGNQLGRAIGVLLTTKAGEKFQCIAVHLPSNGYNIPAVGGEIEKRLATGIPTMVVGDLNLDLRNAKANAKLVKDRPLLQKLVEASEHLWNQPMDKGSVNKRRTPFQPQVSKINLEDFAIKDVILLSEAALGKLEGLIGIADILPSIDCPSDHVLLTWHAQSWPKSGVSSETSSPPPSAGGG